MMLQRTVSVWLASLAVLGRCEWIESLSATGLIGSHFGVPGLDGTYDYVVLGGGTAGLALARRLASDTDFTVAVVNAGDFYEFANGNNTEIPAFAAAFVGSNPIAKNPLLDWYQYTVSQPVRIYLALARGSYANGSTCRALVVVVFYTHLVKF
jgi:choline dehydrogenase-like flavoprotein